MKVVIFTACQLASDKNKVLNITNAFGSLLLPRVPFRGRFAFAIRLFFSINEKGPFSGVLQLSDPEGDFVASDKIQFNVSILPEDGSGIFADKVGEIEATFHKVGEYQFSFKAYGEEQFSMPFFVLMSPRS